MEELEQIIQRMIAAGESEENIKLVIENYKQKEEEPGKKKNSVDADPNIELEKKDTDSQSRDGSSEFRKLSSVLRDKMSRPDVFSDGVDLDEEAFRKVGITPEHLQEDRNKREQKKLSKEQLIKDTTEETSEIYKEFIKGVPRTELNTVNYDATEEIAEGRKIAQKKYIDNNEEIQKTIIPNAKRDIQPALDEYIIEAKKRYDLDDPKKATQENIDAFYKDINGFYSKAVNSKVSANTKFRELVGVFDEVVDKQFKTGLKDFVKSKDSPSLYAAQLFLDNSPLGISGAGGYILDKLTSSWSSMRGVVNQAVKAGVFGGIKEVTDTVVSFNKNEKIAEERDWSDDVVGYWQESDQVSKPFRFVPKFNSDTGNNDGKGTTFKKSGAIEGSWGEFKKGFGNYVSKQDDKASKRMVEIQSEDFAVSNYDNDAFNKAIGGDDILNNITTLGFEQLPQMALSLVTLGASSGLQIGAGIYTDGIENEVRNRFQQEINTFNQANNQPDSNIPLQYLRQVALDDKFMKTLSAKAASGGFVAGQLDRFGASKALSAFTIKSTEALLRGGYKNFLKGVANGVLNNQKSAAIESITESLQEVIQAGAAGSDIKAGNLAQASGTAYLTTSFFGVAGKVKSQTLLEIRSAAKMIAGKLNPKSSEAVFNSKINEIDNLLKKESEADIIKDLTEKRNSIIEIKKANQTLPEGYSIENKGKVLDLIIKRDNISKQIEGKDPVLVEAQSEKIKSINEELKLISSTSVIEKEVVKIKDLAGEIEGLEVKEFASSKKVEEFLDKNKQDLGDVKKASGEQGFIIQNENGTQTIVINREVADKEVAVSVARHEFLHAILFKTLKNNEPTQLALGNSLKSYIDSIDKTQVKDSNFAKRLEQYSTESESVQAEEVLTLFSDAIQTGDIKFNESVFTKVGDVIRKALQALGVKVKFNEGKDVYNFIKDYNKSLDKGKLSKAQVKASKGIKGSLVTASKIEDAATVKKDSKSTQLSPEQSESVAKDIQIIQEVKKENVELAAKYGKEPVKGAKETRLENKIIESIKPIVGRIVTDRTKALYDPIADDAKKTVSRQAFQESMRTDLETMVLTEFNGKQGVEKFLINRGFLRANNLAKRLGIQSAEEGINKGLEAAEKVAVEETTAPKVDKPKYRNILKSNVLPTETVATIKNKVLKTVRTLKSKLDAKVSKNKTVTPLIAEIKNNMGKQADIDFKKAMGGKKDGQLKRFLIKNKKVIVENMTTTWLMGAIPGAVQKQVDGSFTSDWEGKKIDREKTSTAQAGRTSGAEIVRRLPNAFKNLDDKTYLGYVIDETGAPLRGRKESLAKAMGEELSFDIFNQQMQDPDSDIRKAFEGNQEALGVVLADNFVEEISRDIERGTIKFSKAALPYVGKLVKLGIKNGIDEVVDIDGTILVDLEGLKDIDTKGLGALVKKAFDAGLVPDGKEMRFLQSIQGSKIIPEGVKISVKRAITNKSDIKIRETLAKDMAIVADALGSDVTAVIGLEGLGFFNRLLDAAKTKKDKITNKIIPGKQGDFYQTREKILKNQPRSKNLPPNLDLSKVSPMNSKTGVMGKVGRILDKKISAEKKMEEYGKYIPEIEAANIHNKLLAQYVVGTLVDLVRNNKISPKSFISILQAQTNATAGLRALTGLKYITFKNGPQGNLKGEHLADNGTSMFEIAELGFEDNTTKEQTFKIDGILEFHDQWLENRYILDLVDQFGKANPNKDLRIRLLSKKDQAFVYTYDLKPAETLIKQREAAIKARNILSEEIDFKELETVEVRQKAIDNGNSIKFSKTPKKIRVFDFDDTLARTKSNVLYTKPGETLLHHGGDISNLDKIKGAVYLSQDKDQAKAYSKGNEGKVSSFAIKDTDIAREQAVYSEIARLGLKPKSADWNVDELSLHELIDPNFETSLKDSDIQMLFRSLKARGVKAVRFTDMNIKTLKNDISNVVVIDKSVLKEQSKITPANFAKDAAKMEAEGVVWDFSEFSKVMDGKEGPLLEVAKIIADKKGTKDVFVLTARPQEAAGPIQEFLASMGLDIPIENITGLGNGSPQAKADWMIPKIAEGYNDFYFADDHTGNVKAVKSLLNTFDVKGKVQLAKVKFSKSMDKDFNDMLERNTGTVSAAEFSRKVARDRGAAIGKYKIWMPSSLNDFKGLTSYTFAGKGRQGDADQKFFKDALVTPYFRGIAAIELSRQTMKDDFTALNKMFKPAVKKLGKLIPDGDYTNGQAVRVYLWNKAEYEVPGLSKRDLKKMLKYINGSPDLKAYADGALAVSKAAKWVKPTDHWDAQTILSDLGNMTEKGGRKQYIAEFIENVDIVFSEKNLDKVQALYGTRHREALEDIIYRMKHGTNRPSGMNKNQNTFNNWVNNSIGAIMFFNRRSALLQTLSTVNFINWSDNNPAKAALAFANQPQFWKDFSTLFNSAKLKQRRSGLKSDINEAEIASAVKGSTNKATAALSWLLKIGFTPTQIADSFAIAAGGATFYRNRINTLVKKGMSKADAEAKAFENFSEISEETQQSGDPALISSDQASTAGRLLLAFQNTPIQLNRSIKKAAQDIYNRRKTPGQTQAQSDFSNISKMIYYGAIQNIIFTALSSALFALIPGFDDEELTEEGREEMEMKKVSRMANGIVDTTLKGGFGLPGAAVATIKNVIMEYTKQDKKGFTADHTYTILQAANLAPPIGSKLGKIYKGIQTKRFDKEVIQGRGWDVTIDGKFNLSPQYSVLGQWVEGTTNVPLARAVDEINSITEAFDTRNTIMQRVALSLGWRQWDIGTENEENDIVEVLVKKQNKGKKKKGKSNKNIKTSGKSKIIKRKIIK